MLALTSRVTIGNLLLRNVHLVTIESDWEKLTDTCTIQLARGTYVVMKGQKVSLRPERLLDKFQVGDPVRVELGYDGQLEVEFTGYVAGIKPGTIVEVRCEDQMYLLKRRMVTASWRNASLSDIVSTIVPPEISFNVPNVQLGPFRITRVSAAQVLEELKRKYSFNAFFRAGQLVVAQIHQKANRRQVRLQMQKNVVSNELEFVRAKDIRLNVRAINTLPSGKKQEFEFGDPKGPSTVERTLNFYNVPQAELRGRAEAEFERIKFDGYRGDITAFGRPFCQHGDIVEIVDPVYPERAGRYYAYKIKVRFGVGGYRRTITLGPLAR